MRALPGFYSLATLLVAGLAACASNPDRETRRAVETVRIVDTRGRVTQLPLDATRLSSAVNIPVALADAWRAVHDVYEAIGIPITELNTHTHMVGNRGFELRRRLGSTRLSRYLDCGRTQGGYSADTYEVTLSVHTRLAEARIETPEGRGAPPAATMVTTSVEASARPSTFSGHPVRCASTGTLERRIITEIAARAAAASGG